MRSTTALPLFLAASLAAGSCVSLRPYEDVLRNLPARDLVEIDGRVVHVEVRGTGSDVLLLHGFGESTYSWRHLVPALSRHHRTIALDLNGFGYTERPRDPAAYTLTGQSATVLAVLDRLEVRTAHVVGHSYGGALALHLAARFPERVRSLVLLDSAAPSYPDSDKGLTGGGSRLVARLALGAALRPAAIRKSLERAYFDDRLATPEVVREYRARLRVEGVLDAYTGLAAPRLEPRETILYSDIAQPALVLWGVQDRLVPIADGRAAAGAMPHARFIALERCGHSPMEEKPREVLEHLLPFLAEQTAGAS